MRLLVDAEQLDWDHAWSLTQQVFAYTNHTILPEALERWPAELLRRLLPRPFEIIEEIDRRFRRAVAARHPGGDEAERRMAILDETGHVRMAHLAIVGSHSVNGVARLHTEILTQRTFPGFHDHFPAASTTRPTASRPPVALVQPGLPPRHRRHRRWLAEGPRRAARAPSLRP
jgi:starch phosphorylase